MDNDNLDNINKRKRKIDSSRPTVSYHASAGVPLSNIGQYKLLSILGEGGFSVVYLAEQARPVKRLVALKVIKPGMDTKQVIARFEAERQTLAFLNHPNIAPVYDAGATEQGLPYFVMEHVKGIPITEHCDRHKLSIEDRLELFLHVCDGVQYAHQKGIIHRDIKPSNILVSVDSEKAAPRIIDFGVSKATTKQINERTLFTEQGQFVGTPEYMSPEQAEMGAQDIDTRTDIYSLGVVLYELLTGVLPFDPDVLRESSIDNIRKIIREQDPKRPSTILATLGGEEAKRIAENRNIDLSNLKKRLNRELEWIPLKAMRKDRTRRYRSASQFADDIRNYLNRKPLMAGPESAVYKMKKFVNRNKPLFSGAAAILIILIAGIIVSTNFGIKASHAQKEAVAARLKAEQEARAAQAVSDFLRKDLLESMAPYAVQQKQDITVRSWLDDTSAKLEGRFENEPFIEAQIRYSLGKSYFNLGIYELADKHLIRAYALQLEKLGNKNIDTLNTMELLGSVYMKMGLYGDAENLFNQTISGRKEVLKADDPNTLSTMNELAVSYLSSGQYDKAEKLYNEALPISEKVFGENGIFTLLMTGNLADVYRLQGHYKKAEDLYLKARNNMYELYYNSLYALDDPDTLYFAIYSGNGLGMLYINEGNYTDALKTFSDTYKLGTDKLGKGHPDTLYSMNGLGFVYTAMKNYDLARQYIEEALKIEKNNLEKNKLEENNPTTLTSRYCLGWLEYNIGLSKYDELNFEEAKIHFAKAEENLNKALDGRQKVFRYYPDHPAILEAKNALAMLYSAMGSLNDEEAKTLFSKAQEYFNEALYGRQRVLGYNHPATLETQNALAILYWAMGKYSDAKKLLEEILRSRITILGSEHPDTLTTQEAISELDSIMEQEQADTQTEETPVQPD